VRAVTVHDTKAVDARDLSAQFYLTPDDAGANRAEACRERLQELNTAVEVAAAAGELTPEFLGQFQVRLTEGKAEKAAAGPCCITLPARRCVCSKHQVTHTNTLET
jgi:ubiquitin-activating enzyme E1